MGHPYPSKFSLPADAIRFVDELTRLRTIALAEMTSASSASPCATPA